MLSVITCQEYRERNNTCREDVRESKERIAWGIFKQEPKEERDELVDAVTCGEALGWPGIKKKKITFTNEPNKSAVCHSIRSQTLKKKVNKNHNAIRVIFTLNIFIQNIIDIIYREVY